MDIHAVTKILQGWPLSIIALLLLMGAPVYQAANAAPTCDADGDGYFKNVRKCGGILDCNDSDASIYPGAEEVCNGVDDDCDNFIDEGGVCGGGDILICQDGPVMGDLCTSDFDCGVCIGGDTPDNSCASNNDCPPNSGKGSLRGKCEQHSCIVDTEVPCTDADGDGFALEGGECGALDCNDANTAVHPGAVELCGDAIDNNCDGRVDEECTASLPGNLAAAGDSITQAFAADCSCNTNFFCLLCLGGGDQPEHSWFDGTSSSVVSVHDRYLGIDGSIGADKSAAEDGSEMRDAPNNFFEQANAILAQSPLPEHVEVALGGNDLCSRDCVDPANCSDPVYTDSEWRESVRDGLDVLVEGLPDGSTIYMLGVPRVQDLRPAGLVKQQASNVDCEGVWQDFDICTIGTQGRASTFGESLEARLAVIAERQQRYNEILLEEARAYTTNSIGQNPRLIEVLTDYVDESTDSVGTFRFTADDIDGGDCFHPSIQGQSTIADKASQANRDLQ